MSSAPAGRITCIEVMRMLVPFGPFLRTIAPSCSTPGLHGELLGVPLGIASHSHESG